MLHRLYIADLTLPRVLATMLHAHTALAAVQIVLCIFVSRNSKSDFHTRI